MLTVVSRTPHDLSVTSDTSSYIDGSQIYGNTDDLQRDLRTFKDGKLRVKVIEGGDFLPDWNK